MDRAARRYSMVAQPRKERTRERTRHDFRYAGRAPDPAAHPSPAAACAAAGAEPAELAMTDSHAGYIVVLDHDVREDDAEWIINAIRMIKGVIRVSPVLGDHAQFIAQQRRDTQWKDVLYELARNGPGK
jgi:hypothetical protein